MLTEIKIEKLYPHPQNPRKDIGDISELAESIKNQGIFQNLTVIKGGAGVPEGEDGYTVIIGHRRLAASKLAGLETLVKRRQALPKRQAFHLRQSVDVYS